MRPEEPIGARIEAISFDAAGTLFHLAEPVGETYARIGTDHGWKVPGDALEAGFRSAWKEAPPLGRWPGTEALDAHERERAWWRHLVEDTFRRGASRNPGAARENPDRVTPELFGILFDHYATGAAWELYPETRSILARLVAERRRLAVISNFDRRFRQVAADLGILEEFEAVFLSGEIGASKPDRRLFQAAVEGLGCPAEGLLHVGDDPVADWQGARQAGLQAFELKRPETSLADLLP